MNILCEISPFEERTIERGRTAGQKIKIRKVIAADNASWIIADQINNDGGATVNAKYYGSLRMLLADLSSKKSVDCFDLACKITEALKNRTGKEISLTKENLDWTLIDKEYNTSFMKADPDVYQRIFRQEINSGKKGIRSYETSMV